jgi:hypothetical protein
MVDDLAVSAGWSYLNIDQKRKLSNELMKRTFLTSFDKRQWLY